jgi:hypothetical protein
MTLNLDILSKQMNKLENYVTKYIYKKYIEIDTSSYNNSDISDSIDSKLESDLNYIYSKKPKHATEYKLYKDTIIEKDRKSIIKQDEVLKDDLKKMKQSNIDYNKKPLLFKKDKNNSYPDSKRCSYIRKYKNKLLRCKNSIINDDEDICFLHEDSPNIYWDNYIKLLENIDKQ